LEVTHQQGIVPFGLALRPNSLFGIVCGFYCVNFSFDIAVFSVNLIFQS
jgi:hypothetical protein